MQHSRVSLVCGGEGGEGERNEHSGKVRRERLRVPGGSSLTFKVRHSALPFTNTVLMGSSRIFVITVTVVVFGAVMLAVAGLGYQQEWWTLKTAFTLLKWAAWLGIAGAFLSVIGLAFVRPAGRHVLGFSLALVVALATVWMPWSWKQRAGGVPPIHDITTDTQDPPPFVAILPLRVNAKNKAEYGGDSVAAKQRVAYPDIQPVTMPVPPAEAFIRAKRAAEGMGWTMVATDSASGRIEATATTRFFKFKDDIVIRVRPADAVAGTASRVDVRSVSRVGGSDVGTNAARIRIYVKRLRAQS